MKKLTLDEYRGLWLCRIAAAKKFVARLKQARWVDRLQDVSIVVLPLLAAFGMLAGVASSWNTDHAATELLPLEQLEVLGTYTQPRSLLVFDLRSPEGCYEAETVLVDPPYARPSSEILSQKLVPWQGSEYHKVLQLRLRVHWPDTNFEPGTTETVDASVYVKDCRE